MKNTWVCLKGFLGFPMKHDEISVRFLGMRQRKGDFPNNHEDIKGI